MRRLLFLFLIGWLAVEAPPAGWLGITIQELTPQIATRLGIQASEGVFVASVQSGSPADKGGLRAGDVIVALNDRKITSPEALRQAVARLNPGTSLELTLLRGRQEKKIEISVGTPPRDAT